MVRSLRERPPHVELPDGVTIRPHRDGDRDTWQRIQASTGLYDPVAPDLFEREFGDAPADLATRICFAVDSDGLDVGTAAAWHGHGVRREEGRLHWVAVSPKVQRRGIGRALTEYACARFLELGIERVYLTTGDGNVPAVRLYESVGFRLEP